MSGMDDLTSDVPNDDILNLRAVPTPDRVTRIDGCTCDGGDQWHRADCGLFARPKERSQAAIAEARDRTRAYTAELNSRLQALLREAPGE